MARPITVDSPHYDPQAVLRSRLEEAPAEHAEALLALLDIVQKLHDRGVLELLRGALGSSEAVLEIAVDAARSETSIRAIRNLLILAKMLAELDPDVMKAFTQTIPDSIASIVQHPEPASLFHLTKELLWDKDSRRGLSALTIVLETFGKNLKSSTKNA